MYISLSLLFNILLVTLGMVALILLIILLIKIIKLTNSISVLINNNKNSINSLCKDLPFISKNAIAITDNIKGISDVATEATAEAIVAKDNLISNYETIKDIINIIASVFLK